MVTEKLKINHFMFRWYYKRVPEHFRQWTFMKSIKLLIQNYEHDKLLLKNTKEIEVLAIKDADKLRKELENIRMSILAKGIEIEHFNKIFGTDYKKPKEN